MKTKHSVKKSGAGADVAFERLRGAEGAVRTDCAGCADLSLRDIADPRASRSAPAVAVPTKDVKNRGKELNKSFRMSKSSRKRTQNELQLQPRITLRRVKIVQFGRLAQTSLLNVCDAPKAQIASWADHDLSLQEIADPRASGSAPAVALPTKDVKNRGNELNKSFRMNKTSKKTNSEQLKTNSNWSQESRSGESKWFNWAGADLALRDIAGLHTSESAPTWSAVAES